MLKLATVAALTITALASVAQSDPATRADNYVALGATAGIDDGGIYFDPMLSFGHRIGGIFWAHATVAGGPNVEVDGPGKGARLDVAAGVEGRPCLAREQLCGVFGLDVVRRDAYITNIEDNYSEALHDFALRERLGLDVGWRVRFRAGASIESSTSKAFAGLGFDAGIGWSW